MNVLMQLLETQAAGTGPRFTSLGKSATSGGPFAELLAALQHLSSEGAAETALAEKIAALELQPTTFAALLAQPIPFDEVAGGAGNPEGVAGDATNLVPETTADTELLEALTETPETAELTVPPNAVRTATTIAPDGDEVLPQQQQQNTVRPDNPPATRNAELITAKEVQTAQRIPDTFVEVMPQVRPQSTARFTQVESKARLAQETTAAMTSTVEHATVAPAEVVEGGELERLTLRLGHASERALAGGWHAITRLNPELVESNTLPSNPQPTATPGLNAPTGTNTLSTPGAVAGEAPSSTALPQQVRIEHLGPDLVRTVRFLAGSEQSTMTVKLIPAHLGELQVEVVHRGEEISVRLLSSQSSVRETLESQVHLLREQLMRDGTVIQRIEVTPQLAQDSQQGHTGSREAQQQQQQAGSWQGQRQRQERGEQALHHQQTPEQQRAVPPGQRALNIMI